MSMVLEVRAFLEKCKLLMSKQDSCIIILKSDGNVSAGVIIINVDDFLWVGSDETQKTIQQFRDEFVVGSEGKCPVTCMGSEIELVGEAIIVSQENYIEDQLFEVQYHKLEKI